MYNNLPIGTKKTLVAKLSFDVNGSDILVEMMKTMLRQVFIEGGFDESRIAFEVLVNNEEDLVTSMLKAVQSEFQAASAALFAEQATDDEIAEAEKSDGYRDYLRLVTASDESEDKAEDDDA